MISWVRDGVVRKRESKSRYGYLRPVGANQTPKMSEKKTKGVSEEVAGGQGAGLHALNWMATKLALR